MNNFFRHLFASAILAFGFSPTSTLFAQEAPKTEVAPAAPDEPAVKAAEPEQSPGEAATPTVPGKDEELRRLDAPDPANEPPAMETTADGEEQDKPTDTVAVEKDENSAQATEEASGHSRRRLHRHSNDFPLGNHTIPAGGTAHEVVSILGSSVVEGAIEGEAVSILGNTTVNGSTGAEAVAVLGNVYVNGTVGGEAVAVFGNIALGPKAVVHNDVVVIGGRLTRDPGAVVHGNVQEITIFGGSEHFEHLKTWLHRCLLRGRPLAFGADLWWAWAIAGTVFAFYVLLALLFPRAFEKCLETLEQRPGSSMLAVLLTVLITPVLIVVLVITGVGILLLPFMIAGLFFAGVFGKAVMHAWLGRRITKYFGSGALNHVAMATLVGGVMLLLLYTVPFLGLFLFKVLDIIGLGVVVYTLILTLRREKRAAVAPASTARAVPLTATMPGASEATSAPNMADATSLAPPLILAGAMLPRAGFWIRIAASLIDAILVGVLVGLTHAGSAYLLIFATYCVVLWALKGTTIGGIVCGLRVVRLDDRKVDWVVSVVRGLAGFLSLFVAGLGFIWVAFDDQKQSWHDKIAGTTVVLLPKGVSLI